MLSVGDPLYITSIPLPRSSQQVTHAIPNYFRSEGSPLPTVK